MVMLPEGAPGAGGYREHDILIVTGEKVGQSLDLAIDVGTGSVRAALVDRTGRPIAIRAFEHEQIVPEYGWSEQRPADWWAGVTRAIRAVLDDAPDAARRWTRRPTPCNARCRRAVAPGTSSPSRWHWGWCRRTCAAGSG